MSDNEESTFGEENDQVKFVELLQNDMESLNMALFHTLRLPGATLFVYCDVERHKC